MASPATRSAVKRTIQTFLSMLVLGLPDRHCPRASGRHQKNLGGCLLHPRLEPLDLGCRLSLASLDDLEELPVAGALRGLADHGPGDVAEVRHQVEVVQI